MSGLEIAAEPRWVGGNINIMQLDARAVLAARLPPSPTSELESSDLLKPESARPRESV